MKKVIYTSNYKNIINGNKISISMDKGKDAGYEGFLSLEPHLSDFTGFNALENGEEKQDKIFSDGHFAWQVALNALKGILYDLGM